MKKTIFILLIFLITESIAYCQVNNTAKDKTGYYIHSFHYEAGTLIFWGFHSFNYEVTFSYKPKRNKLKFRTGFIYRYDDNFYGIPLTLTALFGKTNKYFELTTGIAPIIDVDQYKESSASLAYTEYNLSVYPVIDFGFRHEPGKGKFFYRIKIGTTGLGVGAGLNFKLKTS